MKIKIDNKNAEKIAAVLASVNGRASEHCYTDLFDVQRLAKYADCEMEKFGIRKKDIIGAVFISVSGERVPNAYARRGFSRVATLVTIERFPTGWFLVGADRAEIYQEGGHRRLWLTPAQDSIAVESLRGKYGVMS